MTQERPNLHGSVLIRLLLNAFRKNSLHEMGISTEKQEYEFDDQISSPLDRKNPRKEFMKKLAKLSKILKSLKQ